MKQIISFTSTVPQSINILYNTFTVHLIDLYYPHTVRWGLHNKSEVSVSGHLDHLNKSDPTVWLADVSLYQEHY